MGIKTKTETTLTHRSGQAVASTDLVDINYMGSSLSNKKADAILKALPEDPAIQIAKKNIYYAQLEAYHSREALLPAVIKTSWSLSGSVGVMTDIASKKYQEFTDMLEENDKIPPKSIVSVQIFGDDAIAKNRNVIPLHFNDEVNDITQLETLVGRSLNHNEFAVVGYADGTHDFKLNKIDNDSLNSLSIEQLYLIIEAYKASSLKILFKSNKDYQSIFYSLPLFMRESLCAHDDNRQQIHLKQESEMNHTNDGADCCCFLSTICCGLCCACLIWK